MPPGSKGPILVIDDDIDIRDAIRDTLELEGYRVAEAVDGNEALAYLRSQTLPPLILLDWNMTPMGGARFMEEVAKEPAWSEIPVVLLSADARAKQWARDYGFVAYLAKPVKLDTMFELLRRHCE